MGNLSSRLFASNCIACWLNQWRLFLRKKKQKPVAVYESSSNSPSRSSFEDIKSIVFNCDGVPPAQNAQFVKSDPPPADKLSGLYVPYRATPTPEEMDERVKMQKNWIHRHRWFFPRKDNKMVIDGSYPLDGDIFSAIKSCPFDEIDIEFRFMNLGSLDGESWHRFCGRLKHLKLHQCEMNGSALFGIVMNANKLASLRLIMPKILKHDLCFTCSVINLSAKKRPALTTLTYCESNAEILEIFLPFLFSVYPRIENLKIYFKIKVSEPLVADFHGPMFTDMNVRDVVLNQIEKHSKNLRSMDLKLTDGNRCSGCQILPIMTILRVSELNLLTKISFYFHEPPDDNFIQVLPSLVHLCAVKWSMNFYDSGSVIYNLCMLTLASFAKLRSLKVVYCKTFTLDFDLLKLLTGSELQKLHIFADNVMVLDGCDCIAFRDQNENLRELKLRIDLFSPASNQINQINRFMKILLRLSGKLRLLHCAPVTDTSMEEIVRRQKKLKELKVELYHCSCTLFAPVLEKNKENRIHSIGDFKNLRHLSVTDNDGELDIGIFSFINSEKVKSLKLFGHKLQTYELSRQVLMYFKKFRQLSCFQLNHYLFVFDPFVQSPRLFVYIDMERVLSVDYAEKNLKLIEPLLQEKNIVRGWFKKLVDKVCRRRMRSGTRT